MPGNPQSPDTPRSPVRASLRHNLRCSVIDGTAYMVMAGLAETFFPIFILLMFKDAAASGLVLTVPLLLANVLQLGAPKLVRWLQSYRKAIVLCAAMQCAACFPLAGLALYGAARDAASAGPPSSTVLVLTFLVASVYYAGATVGGSPWAAMMAALVPTHVRTRFMGRRNRTLQLGAVAGVLLGASLLEAAPRVVNAFLPTTSPAAHADSFWLLRALHNNPQLATFALLFLLAGVARAISTYYLHAHTEPANVLVATTPPAGNVSAPRIGFLRGSHAPLALGVVVFAGAMMLGSPFFHAFAREVAHASMLEYAGLIIIWLLGKALALNWAGDYAQRHGKQRLMLTALLLMIPVPLLWGVSTNLVWLAVAQLLAGVAIGAYELAVWFLTADAYSQPSLSPSQRTRLIARFTLLTALAGAITSTMGGQLLHHLQGTQTAWFAFFAVFALSALARLCAALWISRRTRAGWLRSE